MIVDAFSQAIRFRRLAFDDRMLWSRAWGSIVSFSFGLIIIAGMIYFFYLVIKS
jgi:hypothetical protein